MFAIIKKFIILIQSIYFPSLLKDFIHRKLSSDLLQHNQQWQESRKLPISCWSSNYLDNRMELNKEIQKYQLKNSNIKVIIRTYTRLH